METLFKVVRWIVAAVLGLLVWKYVPETRAIITCVIAVAFVCYVLSILVGVIVKRLIGDELLELRLQSNAIANRLDLLDPQGSCNFEGCTRAAPSGEPNNCS